MLYPYPHPGILQGVRCQVPGIYPGIYPIPQVFTRLKGRVRVWDVVPYPGYCATGVHKVPGAGVDAAHNSHKFRILVRVCYERRTELADVLSRGDTRKKYLGYRYYVQNTKAVPYAVRFRAS